VLPEANKLAGRNHPAQAGEEGVTLSPAGKPQGPLVALSTASVYPDRTPDAFELAARLGYDGIEVMVSADAVSQDVDVIRRLVDYHGIPVLAIHAPCLLVTQRVWGREPWGKLVKSKDVAERLGARVVVVHPPFRWQRDYAREFTAGLERMREETDVVFAVENMYPLRAGGAEVAPYAPHWNPVPQDYPAVTLDLSHTSVSGSDALAMAGELGGRLAHVHLADGTGVTNRDEHLVPGRGAQPCAPLLRKLAAEGYRGAIVLEVNTRRASNREARRADLAEALEFARRHLAAASGSSGGRATAGERRASNGHSVAEHPGTVDPGTVDPGTVDPGTVDPGTADPARSPGRQRAAEARIAGEAQPGRSVAARARSLGRAVSRPASRAGGSREAAGRAATGRPPASGQSPFLGGSVLARVR
jgi:sugar phosphate isomerase/epimerase